ncbi:hypothetical protein [Stutzerimonas degradans]|uniref:Uncharacterized protein n=1 Tax=Stutzerimonas degradans TaxID=2968968 RepID=A0A8E2QFM8_9GAMM|nr:hypothetical protein [Stutzerimonas degradans]MCQ4274497.1 hypothetical protein [Stutzerimonas degradans]PNF77928.1 hypothetical protein CXK95_01135 [Stutzerimonas degradans]QPT23323.1 hypothetical protein I6G33_08745 [Stutzerimonas degradans]
MMPGVVAGFPRAAQGKLVSATAENNYGFASTGAGGASNIGGLDPASFNIVPGAAATPGATGEILDLYWHGQNQFVYLTVRGSYSNRDQLPFTSITVNGVTFTKSTATDIGVQYVGYTIRWNRSANPFPVGAHVINVNS